VLNCLNENFSSATEENAIEGNEDNDNGLSSTPSKDTTFPSPDVSNIIPVSTTVTPEMHDTAESSSKEFMVPKVKEFSPVVDPVVRKIDSSEKTDCSFAETNLKENIIRVSTGQKVYPDDNLNTEVMCDTFYKDFDDSSLFHSFLEQPRGLTKFAQTQQDTVNSSNQDSYNDTFQTVNETLSDGCDAKNNVEVDVDVAEASETSKNSILITKKTLSIKKDTLASNIPTSFIDRDFSYSDVETEIDSVVSRTQVVDTGSTTTFTTLRAVVPASSLVPPPPPPPPPPPHHHHHHHPPPPPHLSVSDSTSTTKTITASTAAMVITTTTATKAAAKPHNTSRPDVCDTSAILTKRKRDRSKKKAGKIPSKYSFFGN